MCVFSLFLSLLEFLVSICACPHAIYISIYICKKLKIFSLKYNADNKFKNAYIYIHIYYIYTRRETLLHYCVYSLLFRSLTEKTRVNTRTKHNNFMNRRH